MVGAKAENREEKNSEQEENQQQTQPIYGNGPKSNPGHIDGRQALLPLRQWICAVPDSHNTLALGTRPREGIRRAGPSLFWVKKKKNHKRKSRRGTQNKNRPSATPPPPPPRLGLRSGSATTK